MRVSRFGIRIIGLSIGIVIGAALSSCSGFSLTGGPGKTVNPSLVASDSVPAELLSVNSFLIAPIEFDSSARRSAAEEASIGEELESAITKELDVQFIDAKQVLAKLQKGESQVVPVPLNRQDVLDAAKARGVEAVLVTRVHEYTERVGSALGAETPASVYFSSSLIRLSDHKEIWQASYRFRDQALSENLFRTKDSFFQSEEGVPSRPGLGFKSADELLRNGFRQMARELAQQRNEKFFVG